MRDKENRLIGLALPVKYARGTYGKGRARSLQIAGARISAIGGCPNRSGGRGDELGLLTNALPVG